MYSARLILFGLVYFALMGGLSSSLFGQIKVVADNSVRVGPNASSKAIFSVNNNKKDYGFYLKNSYEAGSNSQFGIYHFHSDKGTGDKFGLYNETHQNDLSMGLTHGISNRTYLGGMGGTAGSSIGFYNWVICKNSTSGKTIGLYNSNFGQGSGERLGLYNYVTSTTSDKASGLENRVNASNSGSITGIYNHLYSSISPNSVKYGIYNIIKASGTNKNYGEYISMQNSNPAATNIGIYSSIGANTDWAGYFNGNVRVIGTVDQVSDERTKEDIQDIVEGISSVKKLRPRKYKSKKGGTKKDGKKRQKYGFLAQEVEAIFPDMVTTASVPGEPILETRKDEEGNVTEEIVGYEKDEELKSLNYSALIPILTKAIQEQQEQIEAMQKEITELKKRLK